jgi:penicillin amidase
VSGFALRHREAAAAAFRAAGHPALADSLSAWDGTTTIDRREPLLFHAWAEALRFRLARAAYGDETGYFPRDALDRLLAAGEVGEAMASEAAREAVERAGALAWGDAHPLALEHPLGAVPALATTLGFASRSFPVPGDPFTVNVASHGGRAPPFVVTHGPSQRHVVDLGDLDAGGFVLPGGQSGLPRSRHAFDQLPLWLSGELVPLPLSRAAVEARTASRLRLLPAPRP